MTSLVGDTQKALLESCAEESNLKMSHNLVLSADLAQTTHATASEPGYGGHINLPIFTCHDFNEEAERMKLPEEEIMSGDMVQTTALVISNCEMGAKLRFCDLVVDHAPRACSAKGLGEITTGAGTLHLLMHNLQLLKHEVVSPPRAGKMANNVQGGPFQAVFPSASLEGFRKKKK